MILFTFIHSLFIYLHQYNCPINFKLIKYDFIYFHSLFLYLFTSI